MRITIMLRPLTFISFIVPETYPNWVLQLDLPSWFYPPPATVQKLLLFLQAIPTMDEGRRKGRILPHYISHKGRQVFPPFLFILCNPPSTADDAARTREYSLPNSN